MLLENNSQLLIFYYTPTYNVGMQLNILQDQELKRKIKKFINISAKSKKGNL
jgi:hypothetical protein